MPREENHVCCCHHEHSTNCLFIDFVDKHCGGDVDKACQILHQDSCDCYKKIIKAKQQMLLDKTDLHDGEIDTSEAKES